MSPEVAIFIAATFISIYLLLCGIECGVALVRLFPRLSTKPKKHAALLGPGWEASSAFLIFGLTTLGFFFTDVFEVGGAAAITPVIVAVCAALIRAALRLGIFVTKTPLGLRLSNVLFAFACFTAPLALAAFGYYLLNGAQFWEQPYGWVVMGASLSALTAIGLVPALSGYGGRQYWLLSGMAYLFALAPLGLVWGNMPYVIYQKLTLNDGFSAPHNGDIVLVVLALCIPLLLLGFWRALSLSKPADS